MKSIFLTSFLFVFLTVTFNNCKKETITPDGEMAFWVKGLYSRPQDYRFTLIGNQLFDNERNVLPDSLWQKAKLLLNEMPAVLCDSSTEAYGCGLCLDTYDYFLRTRCNGKWRTWQMNIDPNNPSEVNAFVTKLIDLEEECLAQ